MKRKLFSAFSIARPEESSSSIPDAEVCLNSSCGTSATADPRNKVVWGNNGETVVLDSDCALVLSKTHGTSETLIPMSV